MKIEKSRHRPGPIHRISMSFSHGTYQALHAQSKRLGYSIAGVARQVVDRAMAAGLLDKDIPSPHGADVVRVTQDEHREHLNAEISRLHEKHIDILQDRLDLKEQRIAQLQQVLDMNALTITELSGDLQFYQQGRVADVPDPGGEG